MLARDDPGIRIGQARATRPAPLCPDLRLVAIHALLGSESWRRRGLSEEESEISPAATAGKIMHRFWGSFELSRPPEAGYRQYQP